MIEERKNINRGYRKLIVWQDSIAYYGLTCDVLRGAPFELKKVSGQQIACVDSIHRNIAEGYCRRSLKEYLQFLNIGLGSLGESVSGWSALLAAQQISQADHERVDALAYKLENGMLRLIESLQRKSLTADWEDSFILRESNASYGSATA